jgi:hypothetical protein
MKNYEGPLQVQKNDVLAKSRDMSPNPRNLKFHLMEERKNSYIKRPAYRGQANDQLNRTMDSNLYSAKVGSFHRNVNSVNMNTMVSRSRYGVFS